MQNVGFSQIQSHMWKICYLTNQVKDTINYYLGSFEFLLQYTCISNCTIRTKIRPIIPSLSQETRKFGKERLTTTDNYVIGVIRVKTLVEITLTSITKSCCTNLHCDGNIVIIYMYIRTCTMYMHTRLMDQPH